jgi:hypothetical protein
VVFGTDQESYGSYLWRQFSWRIELIGNRPKLEIFGKSRPPIGYGGLKRCHNKYRLLVVETQHLNVTTSTHSSSKLSPRPLPAWIHRLCVPDALLLGSFARAAEDLVDYPSPDFLARVRQHGMESGLGLQSTLVAEVSARPLSTVIALRGGSPRPSRF